jgi:hypothetical protein
MLGGKKCGFGCLNKLRHNQLRWSAPTMMRRPALIGGGGGGGGVVQGGGWRLVGVGFLFGAALATCLALSVRSA